MITNKGKELWAAAIGNLNNGYTGTINKATGTTLKAASSPKWKANAFVGQSVYAGAYAATILSNTETELVVARWEKLPTATHEEYSRAEEAPAPPAEGAAFTIASGTTPAAWVAVSADTEEPKATNTVLKGEIKTTGGGLVRGVATFKYLGGKEYEVKITFTANAEDVVPVILAKIGIFDAQNGGLMMFESLLTSTAEIKSSGDSVTITDIVSGS